MKIFKHTTTITFSDMEIHMISVLCHPTGRKRVDLIRSILHAEFKRQHPEEYEALATKQRELHQTKMGIF